MGNAKGLVCMSVGNLSDMASTSTLLGLPLASSDSVIRGSMALTSTTQGTLGCSTLGMLTETLTTWLRLGSKPSLLQLPQCSQGVYVGAENLAVSSKLTKQICRWEFINMTDLLSEVRLSDREGESEKLLQRRPWCVTDIWSWLHCFGTHVSVLAPFTHKPS